MKKLKRLALTTLAAALLAAPGARAALPDVPIEEPPPPESSLDAKPTAPPASAEAPRKRRARPSRRAPARERAPRKPDVEAQTQAREPVAELEVRSL